MNVVDTKKKDLAIPRENGIYNSRLLIPLLILWVFTYIAPLILLFFVSFLNLESISFQFKGFTLDNYIKFLSDPFYTAVIFRTLKLAFITTGLTLLLGVPYAVIFTMVPPWFGKVLLVLIISPTLMSAIVRSYGWIIILGGNGMVNYALLQLGLIDAPIRFLFNFNGVAIGLTQILLPFMVLPVISVLQSTDFSLTEAAANLGATRSQILTRITLPLSIPGMLAGGSLVFVLAYAHFAVPQLLGGGSFLVNSTLIYQQATALENYGGAAALSIILMVSSLAIVFMGNKLVGKLSQNIF